MFDSSLHVSTITRYRTSLMTNTDRTFSSFSAARSTPFPVQDRLRTLSKLGFTYVTRGDRSHHHPNPTYAATTGPVTCQHISLKSCRINHVQVTEETSFFCDKHQPLSYPIQQQRIAGALFVEQFSARSRGVPILGQPGRAQPQLQQRVVTSWTVLSAA